MSLILLVILFLIVITMVVALYISLKKRTVIPVIVAMLIILLGYLGLSSPYCYDTSDFFVEDDPTLELVLSKRQTVGNFIWSAPRWKVDGDKVTSCNAMYEVLILSAFGR